MAATYTQDDEIFSRIWASITQEHLIRLLSRLNPEPKGSRQVDIMCPSCGMREAFAYEPQHGRCPRIHCNRKDKCHYDETLWTYLITENGDKKAVLEELCQLTHVSLDTAQRRQYSKPAPPVYTPASPPKAVAVNVPADMEERQAEYLAAFPGSPAQAYLRSRGVSEQFALSGGFGYSPGFMAAFERDGSTRLYNSGPRLTYPLRNQTGDIIAIEGRAIYAVEHKDRIRSYGPKDTGLFFPSGQWNKEDLHLVEGAVDACALAQIGLNAAGKSGTAVPLWLPATLSMRDVYTAYDADNAGDTAAADFANKGALRSVRTKRVRPMWPEHLGPPPDKFKDWGDLLKRGEDAVRLAYTIATGKHTSEPAQAPQINAQGQKPPIPAVTPTHLLPVLRDARIIDSDLARILAAMERGEGIDTHSFDDLAITAGDLLEPLQQACEKLAGQQKGSKRATGFYDPERPESADCIIRYASTLQRLLRQGEMLAWSPSSPAWLAFAAGSQGARVNLADGVSVIVIPELATVPAGITDYIRPSQFWEYAQDRAGYGWQIVSQPSENAVTVSGENAGELPTQTGQTIVATGMPSDSEAPPTSLFD